LTSAILDLHSTATSPIGTVGSGKESFVDHVTAQSRIVGMEGLKNGVDLALGVSETHLELIGKALENDPATAEGSRHLR
jgi:hypothetical protein